MTRPPAEISFRFYAALDAMEKCLIDIGRRYPSLEPDCHWFCNHMEEIADDVIEIAAFEGWKIAYFESGFLDFQRDYEEFVNINYG